MNRLEVVELGLVVEWDEESGEATVGVAGERGWETISGLRGALDGRTGGWEELGTLERHSTRPTGVGIESCFAAHRGAERVAVWRVRFLVRAESRWVAWVVSAALGDLNGLPRGN